MAEPLRQGLLVVCELLRDLPKYFGSVSDRLLPSI